MKWIKWYGQQWLNSTARYELNEAERGLFVDFCSLASVETIGLKEGQFKIASWQALAHKLNSSIENVISARNKCLQSRISATEIPGEGIIVTILNWHKYQPAVLKEKTPPAPPVKENNILDKIRVDKIRGSPKIVIGKTTKSPKSVITPKITSKNTHKSYGEFQNVLLSDDEFHKLSEKFGDLINEKIERLSAGIASKGYKYKSHYATILNWDRKDREQDGRIIKSIPGNISTGGFAELDKQ